MRATLKHESTKRTAQCEGEKATRQPAAADEPASGGVASRLNVDWKSCSVASTLETRLSHCYKPAEVVEMRHPVDSAAAVYVREDDAAIAYMQPAAHVNKKEEVFKVQWLPQEAADWLYQAMHYVMPFLQTLLGTNRAFDAHGVYRDATSGEPASGGQLAAFWGTEIGSRRDRALIAYDADVDFEAFVTPCCDFDKIWVAATTYFESRDLMCKVTRKGKYYRISPRHPLTSNDWKEWCLIWCPAFNY